METIPRIQSLGHVPKNSPQVLPSQWPSRQLRDGVAQVSSGEKTASQTSSQCDDADEFYEDPELIIGDEVNICKVKQQKVCQSINKIKLH